MKPVYFGLPAILCGVTSFIALVATVRAEMFKKYAEPLMFAFLPGCFLLTGAVMLLMYREIRRLRRRVARLEHKRREAANLQVVSSENRLANAG